MIDDNAILPICMLPELVKLKYSVSEEELNVKGALPPDSEKAIVALWFTGVVILSLLPPESVADNALTEVGISVKRKLIV